MFYIRTLLLTGARDVCLNTTMNPAFVVYTLILISGVGKTLNVNWSVRTICTTKCVWV